jgi:hypothetical protein
MIHSDPFTCDFITKPITLEMDDWLRNAIGNDGKVYEDVTFKPM